MEDSKCGGDANVKDKYCSVDPKANVVLKRKDDLAMIIHHYMAISLISLSYYTNTLRIGIYVLYLNVVLKHPLFKKGL